MLLVVSIFVLMVTCDSRYVRKVTVTRHTAVTPKLQPPTKNKIPTTSPKQSIMWLTPTPSPTGWTGAQPTPSPDSRTQAQPTPSPDRRTNGQPTPSPDRRTLGQPTTSPYKTPGPIYMTVTANEHNPTPPTPTPIEQNEVKPTSRIQCAIQPMGMDHQVQEAKPPLLNASMEKSMQRSIRSDNGLHSPERSETENDEEVYCNDYNAATILNTKCTIVIICFATVYNLHILHALII